MEQYDLVISHHDLESAAPCTPNKLEKDSVGAASIITPSCWIKVCCIWVGTAFGDRHLYLLCRLAYNKQQ